MSKLFIWDLVEWITNIPTVLGILLRNLVYPIFIKMPRSWSKRKIVKIYRDVRITEPNNFEIGEGSSVNAGSVFLSAGKISIGKNVLIAPKCVFASHQHTFLRKDIPIYDQPLDKSSIIINDNVWIGASCILLPSVEIGKGVIIGAGSVVTKNIPEMEIWAGNPAKKIKKR